MVEESSCYEVHVLRSVFNLLCNSVCFWGGLHLWGHMCGLWGVHRMHRTAMGEAAHFV